LVVLLRAILLAHPLKACDHRRGWHWLNWEQPAVR
jgi:hypothetical protein